MIKQGASPTLRTCIAGLKGRIDDIGTQTEAIKVDSSTFEALHEELDAPRANGEWNTSIILQATIQGLEDRVGYMKAIISNLPKAAFLLLPLFAMLHKLVDLRQKRYYIDYLVFSLKFHAFAFFIIGFGILLGLISSRLGFLAEIRNLLIPVYGVVGFKNFNQQGWVKSILNSRCKGS